MAKTFEIAFMLAGKINSSFKSSFLSANDKLAQMNIKISSLKHEIKGLEKAQKSGQISALEYSEAYAKLAKQLEKTEQAQKKLAKATNLQKNIENNRVQARSNMLSGIETAATVGTPVAVAMKFESSMADVRKVVNFDTPEQFKAMEKDILDLSKRIPMAADGLAQIVAAAGQAGIARGDLIKFAESAAKMGVAFDISADEAGQMMAQWRSAFKMNQQQVNTLADQINYLGNTTAASAPKISEVVRRIGPLGEVGGAAASQIAALGATMVSAGIDEEVAATGIKNLILGLTAGEGATKSQAAAFQSLGLNAKDMAKMMQQDAQGAIMKVMQALQKLPKEKQAAVLSDLFGKESIGAIAPLLTNLNALEDNFKKVGDSTKYAGSMQKEFEARASTTENQLQLLKNRAIAAGIALGTIMLPFVNQASQWLGLAADKVQAFSEKYPGLTKALVIGASSVLGFSVALAGLKYVFSIVTSPFASFYAWATKVELAQKMATWATKAWTAAQWALNIAMSMNPIGLVIAAIAGLIGVGVLLYKNFDSVRNIVDSLWGKFKETFPGAAQLIETVGSKVGALWDKLKGFWRWLTGGGRSSGGSTVSSNVGSFRMLEGRASGGIVNYPVIAGEAGPEAIIPLNKSPRAVRLWERTGDLLGVNSRGGETVINLNYAPTINAPGGDPLTIRQELNKSKNDFERWFRSMVRQERRLSYE